MQAVRENRYVILSKDFEKAYKKAIKKDDQEHDFYKWYENTLAQSGHYQLFTNILEILTFNTMP